MWNKVCIYRQNSKRNNQYPQKYISFASTKNIVKAMIEEHHKAGIKNFRG